MILEGDCRNKKVFFGKFILCYLVCMNKIFLLIEFMFMICYKIDKWNGCFEWKLEIYVLRNIKKYFSRFIFLLVF